MDNVVPITRYLSPLTPDQAREQGYRCLSPLERAVAIEFVTTGHTLKQIAADMDQPLAAVKMAFGSPIVRAFIHDLQQEVAQHKIVNEAWVQEQVLAIWPQLIGEEEVHLVNKSGDQIKAKKFHGPEVASILKHFSGNKDQRKAGGVQVTINFESVGVGPPKPVIDVTGAEDA